MSGGRLSPLFTWRSAIVESDLPPTTRHVLLTLSLHMNERGGSCFPAHDTLANETGLNRATVIRHVQAAEDAGWLTVARTTGRKSNTYTATVPTVAENDGSPESNRRPPSDQPSSSARQPSFSVTPTVAQDDPSTSRGRQEDAIEDATPSSPIGDARASLFVDPSDNANARANSDGASDVTTRATSEKHAAGPSSEAWGIQRAVHGARKPEPPNRRNTALLAQRFLDADYPAEVVQRAMTEAPACSQGAVEVWLSRNAPKRQRVDRDVVNRDDRSWMDENGRVEL